MMPAISAGGDTPPPLFVFKGKRLPFREVLNEGRQTLETPADLLPRKSVVCMREERGGVDMHNFLSWGKRFVDSVRDLVCNSRKLLLTYDAYCGITTLTPTTQNEGGKS